MYDCLLSLVFCHTIYDVHALKQIIPDDGKIKCRNIESKCVSRSSELHYSCTMLNLSLVLMDSKDSISQLQNFTKY